MPVLRFVVLVVVLGCWVAGTSSVNITKEDELDYIDDIKHYSAHHSEEASAKYTEKLNKIDMIEDYPHDDDLHDHEHLEDYEEDEEEEEEYDDEEGEEEEDYEEDAEEERNDGEDGAEDDEDEDDDEDGGGCGGGDDDDDDDEEEEELNPVQEVIEEYFTR